MLISFLNALLLILILQTILWLVSIYIKNVSIVDIFWGLSFVVINSFYFFSSGDFNIRKLIFLILVTIWGVRLTIYLAWRNYGKGEDFRYQNFRRKYGPERYWWFSYFQVFILQGTLSLIIALPFLAVNHFSDYSNLNWLDYLGMFIWVIGFTFEAGGDYQLSRFKKDPSNRGKVLNSGFWKYTRHPNYFGDATVWWAFGVFSIASGNYWMWIGSIIMTLLIIKVSGVALLEKSLSDQKPQYHDYIEKTNSFIPWFPKNDDDTQ